MEPRRLGKTGNLISPIGFGAWAIGGTWGEVDDDTASPHCTVPSIWGSTLLILQTCTATATVND